MVVARKKDNDRGRRYVIVHAGCSDGWVAEPLIFEAKRGNHHDNMNSKIFEGYMRKLCDASKERWGNRKVVFCMDNAKYHRREAIVGDDDSDQVVSDENRRTLSQLRKSELIYRVLKLDIDKEWDLERLNAMKKPEIYTLAKQYKVPLVVENIVER